MTRRVTTPKPEVGATECGYGFGFWDEGRVVGTGTHRELMADNKAMMVTLRDAHEVADVHDDVGTTSMLEIFIDGAEKRNWFLFEASRHAEHSGH